MKTIILTPSNALAEKSPDGMGHNYLCVQSYQLSEIVGDIVQDFRHKPWRGRVVRIRKVSSEGENIAVYRLIRGSGSLLVSKGQYWMSRKTCGQLDLGPEDKIKVDVPFQFWGRFCYYNNHLEDATRFSFRIGFWGLFLAAISLTEPAWRLAKWCYERLN